MVKKPWRPASSLAVRQVRIPPFPPCILALGSVRGGKPPLLAAPGRAQICQRSAIGPRPSSRHSIANGAWRKDQQGKSANLSTRTLLTPPRHYYGGQVIGTCARSDGRASTNRFSLGRIDSAIAKCANGSAIISPSFIGALMQCRRAASPPPLPCSAGPVAQW